MKRLLLLALKFLTIFFTYFHTTNACLATGICCCGITCMPAPAMVCNPASCQPGYTCGHYGCARNKARSALTKKDGLIVSVDEYVNKTLLNPKRIIFDKIKEKKYFSEGKQEEYELDKNTFLKLTNPNFLFRQCCEDRKLPDVCLRKCHFNTYTKETLQQMYFKRDPCPIAAATDIQYCAAQGRDHSRCCAKVGIASTLAGNKCLAFCDQRAGKVTKLDFSYLPCYDHFESMKRCFYNEIRMHMETILLPKLEKVSRIKIEE
uniref:Domain of unknown function DB domain-containing protein n=1 Tax=Meloidogyne enterolobii TaxID=390850 RepID=A0A6V7V3M2_MELEN|nr:unnamed protein product [Meloidogyne enterolobii]